MDRCGSGKLVVEVSGFHSDQGQLVLRIYAHEAGFPIDGCKALRQLRQPTEHGRATVTLDGLPFGSYAIGCLHAPVRPVRRLGSRISGSPNSSLSEGPGWLVMDLADSRQKSGAHQGRHPDGR